MALKRDTHSFFVLPGTPLAIAFHRSFLSISAGYFRSISCRSESCSSDHAPSVSSAEAAAAGKASDRAYSEGEYDRRTADTRAYSEEQARLKRARDNATAKAQLEADALAAANAPKGMAAEKLKDIQSQYSNLPEVKDYRSYAVTQNEVKGLLKNKTKGSDAAAIMKFAKAMSGEGALSETDQIAAAESMGGVVAMVMSKLQRAKDGTLTDGERHAIWGAVQTMGKSKHEAVYQVQNRLNKRLGGHDPRDIYWSTGRLSDHRLEPLDLGEDINDVDLSLTGNNPAAPPLIAKPTAIPAMYDPQNNDPDALIEKIMGNQ